ncbi:MAG: GspH/FimT family pseudopilin [Rhodoferax sp.]|nr:GspH/FimT family pseudopilin [Rhodoferax sp.]
MQEPERCQGATLSELLVVLAIAALLLSMAAPSLSAFVTRVRLKAASDLLVAHLHLARSEAIKRNSRAVLCKSADGQHCATAGGWEQGWIVFHDANGNAFVDPGETILQQQGALRGLLSFSGNALITDYVAYTPDGGANRVSGAFQAGTFILCALSDVPMQARQIVISKAGQIRVALVSGSMCDQPG